MNRRAIERGGILFALLLAIRAAAAAPAYHAVDLYTYGIGDGYSIVSHNNRIGDGGTTGGWVSGPATNNRIHAMLWSPQYPNGLDLHRGGFFASDVAGSNATQQFGSAQLNSNPSQVRAYAWSGTASSATDLHPSGFEKSELLTWSNGQGIGRGGGADGNWHALVWNGSSSNVVDLHPATYESSHGVAADGVQQVGNAYPENNASNYHAALWSGSAESFVDLNPAGYSTSQARGVANGYQVGFGNRTGGPRALRWNGTAASAVALPGGTRANAISSDGQIIVGTTTTTGFGAMAWIGPDLTPIDLHGLLPPGFSTSDATFVAADGTIYGTASFPNEPRHVIAWVVPEPHAAISLLGAGLVLRIRARSARRA